MKVLSLGNYDKQIQSDQQIKVYRRLIDQIVKSTKNGTPQTILKNPGQFYKNAKQMVQKFSFLTPAILHKLQTKQMQQVKVKAIRSNPSVDSETWMSVQKTSQYIVQITMNNNAAKDIRYTDIDPTRLLAICSSVQQYIQQQGVVAFLDFAKATYFDTNVFISPTMFYSELCSFVIENQRNFRPNPYNVRRETKQLIFSKYLTKNNIQRVTPQMLDFIGISFPMLSLMQQDGIKAEQVLQYLQKQGQSYGDNYKKIEVAESRLIDLNKSLKRIEKKNNDQQIKQIKKLEEIPIKAQMKQQAVQNISQSILDTKKQVDQTVQSVQASANNTLQEILKVQLPLALQQISAGLLQTQIKNAKQFFTNEFRSLTSSYTQIPLSDLNMLPKDVHMSIIFLQNKRRIKNAEIRNQLVKDVAQIRKIQAMGTMNLSQFQSYIKERQKSIMDKIFQFVSNPTQTIKILRQKGDRLNRQFQQMKTLESGQKQLRQTMQTRFQSVFGDFSTIHGAIQQSFGETRQQMRNFLSMYQQQKNTLLGLSTNIQTSFRTMFVQLQGKFVQSTNSKIQELQKTLNTTQNIMSTSFSSIIGELNYQKEQLQTILTSLAKISQQIVKIGDQVTQLTKISQKTSEKTDLIMQQLTQFLKNIQTKGLEGLYDQKIGTVKEKVTNLSKLQQQYAQRSIQANQKVKQLQKQTAQKQQLIKQLQKLASQNQQKFNKNVSVLKKSVQQIDLSDLKKQLVGKSSDILKTALKQLENLQQQRQSINKKQLDELKKQLTSMENGLQFKQLSNIKKKIIQDAKPLEQMTSKLQKIALDIQNTKFQLVPSKLKTFEESIGNQIKDIKKSIQQQLNTIKFDRSKLQQQISNALNPSSYNINRKGLQQKINEILSPSGFKFDKQKLQQSIFQISNPTSYKFEKKDLQNAISQALDPKGYAISTEGLQRAIQQNLNPERYVFKTQSLQNKINEVLNPDSYNINKANLQNRLSNLLNPQTYNLNTSSLQQAINRKLDPNSYQMSNQALQNSIQNALNPINYKFDTSGLQGMIQRAMHPSNYTFDTQPLMSSIQNALNPSNYLIKENADNLANNLIQTLGGVQIRNQETVQAYSDRLNEIMATMYNAQVDKIKKNTIQLSQVNKFLSQLGKNVPSTQFVDKLPEILKILFQNFKDISKYQDKNMTGKSLHQRINDVGTKIDNLVKSMKNNKSQDLTELTNKLLDIQNKVDMFRNSFISIANQVKVLFEDQTQYMMDFIDDMIDKGIFKGKVNTLQYAIKQIKQRHQSKVDGFLAVILNSLPTRGGEFDQQQVYEEVQKVMARGFQKVKFDWWKTANKKVKLQ